MLHLKNITKADPKTAEQHTLTEQAGVVWLYTEDGDNWYDIMNDFSDDTLKVAYETATGKVLWAGQDVTGLNPYLMSVIELEDTPDNRCIVMGSYWFYLNDSFVFDYALKAQNERNTLLAQAASIISDWKTELELGIISDEDKASLTQWMAYIKSLKALDLSQVSDETAFNSINWPETPDM